ncbi:MAG TPA: NAD+ synthase [Anaerolineales bacterium]|nr:NAD+ synthase [Anaerolineales bacterium]
MRTLRVGLAQMNMTVGDFEGNTEKMLQYIERARSLEVDLLCFPEMAITGYPPEDLLLRSDFITANLEALQQLTQVSRGITMIIGFVDPRDDLYNAAAVVSDGRLAGVYHKHYLPNYGVFDENRYFQAGRESPVFGIRGAGVGITISEDIWYPGGPARLEALAGAEVLVTITASPFHARKRDFRERMLSIRASDNAAFLCYLNPVGGQDELVFDGGSMIFDPQGNLIARCPQFQEYFLVADLILDQVRQARLHDPRRRKDALESRIQSQTPWAEISSAVPTESKPALTESEGSTQETLDILEEVYSALVLGTRDYVRKNNFEKVLLAMSGGLDSSIVAALAVDALGSENVIGVSMPSRYSSAGSRSDAAAVAAALGIQLWTLPIEGPFDAMLSTLREVFHGTEPGVAEENLQARIRSNLLMAVSNKFGWLMLSTGNKSEMATGYTTLYGDMAGGFAVIKDVPKTLLYQLAEYRNRRGAEIVIPQSILSKPPSAELRSGQLDTDTLPPYPVLDPILQAYVEEDKSAEEIVNLGFDPSIVQQVIRMVERSEYKRRQGPPGIKITPRAFGKDRRLPIVNHYK